MAGHGAVGGRAADVGEATPAGELPAPQPEAAPPAATPPAAPEPPRVVVFYDFDPAAVGECPFELLPLREGQEVELVPLTELEGSQWILGYIVGVPERRGYFPRDFVGSPQAYAEACAEAWAEDEEEAAAAASLEDDRGGEVAGPPGAPQEASAILEDDLGDEGARPPGAPQEEEEGTARLEKDRGDEAACRLGSPQEEDEGQIVASQDDGRGEDVPYPLGAPQELKEASASPVDGRGRKPVWTAEALQEEQLATEQQEETRRMEQDEDLHHVRDDPQVGQDGGDQDAYADETLEDARADEDGGGSDERAQEQFFEKALQDLPAKDNERLKHDDAAFREGNRRHPGAAEDPAATEEVIAPPVTSRPRRSLLAAQHAAVVAAATKADEERQAALRVERDEQEELKEKNPFHRRSTTSLGMTRRASSTDFFDDGAAACAGPLQLSDPAAAAAAVAAKELRQRSETQEHFSRVVQVSGTVLWARSLPNTDTWGKSDPYCVVKGIRSNNHLVDVACTKVMENNLNPEWKHGFEFVCPKGWGLDQLVGLKFLVYDSDDGKFNTMGSDDFLGGADLDLSELQNTRLVERKLELGGVEIRKAATKATILKKRKSLLCVQVRVSREVTGKPPPPSDILTTSLASFQRCTMLDVHLVKARNLRNADLLGKSDPQCVVHVLTATGDVEEIHRTEVIDDSLNPVWDERFSTEFAPALDRIADEPVILVFDVYDSDKDGGDVTVDGEHLGSALLPLWDFAHGAKCRRRLTLHGGSQLLKTLLGRDGRPGQELETRRKTVTRGSGAAPSRPSRMPTSMTSDLAAAAQGGLKAGAVSALATLSSFKVKAGGPKDSAIYVEVALLRCEEPMPLITLLKQPFQIREEEHVQEAMAWPDWQRTFFPVPPVLKRDSEREGRPQLATLRVLDKVVFVYGVVQGATGLISTDYMGKSDPYCVVEGTTVSGERHFIHRTRCIQDQLCPAWRECFHFAVPATVQLQRLTFSVFDSDSLGEGLDLFAGGGGSDDFLGRMSIDLSYLVSGDRICEDIPLTGARAARPTASKSNTPFRRNSSLSVEVRVERRLMPVYEARKDQMEWIPPLKHAVSREPPTRRRWEDVSQLNAVLEPHEVVARRVLQLYETSTLVDMGQQRRTSGKWLRHLERGSWGALAGHRPPPRHRASGAKLGDADEAVGLEEERALLDHRRPPPAAEGPDALHDLAGLVRSGAPAPKLLRTASLPTIHSQFGSEFAARLFARTRPGWVDGFRFQSEAMTRAGPLTRAMGLRPELAVLTQTH